MIFQGHASSLFNKKFNMHLISVQIFGNKPLNEWKATSRRLIDMKFKAT